MVELPVRSLSRVRIVGSCLRMRIVVRVLSFRGSMSFLGLPEKLTVAQKTNGDVRIRTHATLTFIYVCVCMYTHTYIYMHIRIYTYMCVCVLLLNPEA